jgi:hypothetical protein
MNYKLKFKANGMKKYIWHEKLNNYNGRCPKN